MAIVQRQRVMGTNWLGNTDYVRSTVPKVIRETSDPACKGVYA